MLRALEHRGTRNVSRSDGCRRQKLRFCGSPAASCAGRRRSGMRGGADALRRKVMKASPLEVGGVARTAAERCQAACGMQAMLCKGRRRCCGCTQRLHSKCRNGAVHDAFLPVFVLQGRRAGPCLELGTCAGLAPDARHRHLPARARAQADSSFRARRTASSFVRPLRSGSTRCAAAPTIPP